ncbi:hypothetical protein G4B88_008222, partial [Cannabis sativa]
MGHGRFCDCCCNNLGFLCCCHKLFYSFLVFFKQKLFESYLNSCNHGFPPPQVRVFIIYRVGASLRQWPLSPF